VGVSTQTEIKQKTTPESTIAFGVILWR